MSLPSFSSSRRRLLAGAAAALVAAQAQAVGKPAELPMAELINQAGRQRMLSQRMAKLYVQQVMGVRGDEARRLQADSLRLFETQLDTLRSYAMRREAAALISTYGSLASLWVDYRRACSAVSKDGIKPVAALSDQVLSLAHTGTVQWEQLYGEPLGQLVNLAGRQRMLSQRMAKSYFLIAAGQDSASLRATLDSAHAEFVAAMQTLKRAPQNTTAINNWFALAETQWLFFDDALLARNGGAGDSAVLANNVAVSSENILQAMDKLAELYAKLS